MNFNFVKNKRFSRISALIVCALLALSSYVFGNFTKNGKAFAADGNYNYYMSDYKNSDELYRAAETLNQEVCEEGYVLMKNDGMLPLKPAVGNAKVKISIFGKNSNRIIDAGYGSSDNFKAAVSLYDAFNESSKFDVNPQLKAFYANDGQSGVTNPLVVHRQSIDNDRYGISTYETPYSRYTDTVKNSYANYNDAAIVVLSRYAGEGSDLPMTSLKSWNDYSNNNKLDSARDWQDHYLQLDRYEVEMLQKVMDSFENVMILVNSAAQMELGFLNDPTHYLFTDNSYTATLEAAQAKMNKIKAAMFIGYPGTSGTRAIPRILDGTVNPSGHFSDTWVYNMKNDPVWQNFGLNGRGDGAKWGEYFVQYDEDIYMGYRYYETRYITENQNGDAWYNSNVLYPFGYGLSYTTFDWEVKSVVNSTGGTQLGKNGKITVQVEVTNTGEAAGKDVVQLYYNTPYYTGGISKAHVVLGGFAKTDLLEPNESQILTLTLNVSDMYSYDWSDANNNGFKGYELDAGDYNIIIAHDAHDAATMPEAFTGKFNITTGFMYETDTKTGAAVGNLFDNVSGTGKVNNPETFKGVRRYFSRDDFDGTFPMYSGDKKNGMKQARAKYTVNESFDIGKPWYSETAPAQAAASGTAETNKVKLWHLRGRDYNDPLWNKLLDQLTIEEMAALIGNGFRGPRAISSIDMPDVWDTDGPLGRRETPGSIQWASNPILAGTYNVVLAEKQGEIFGNDVFFGPTGRGGTYGVGLDTHRSPFGGRNFEYYSEDGLLGGKLGAKVIEGSNSKGGYQVVKHIFLNDGETERNTVQTWASEQAMREIYAKPFEIAVKEGGCNAMMAGVNFIGDWTCAESWPLLTGLIRNEWGFEGFVITDMLPQNANMCIRAGTDTMMAFPGINNPKTDTQSLTATHITNIRKSAKNILFTRANSSGVNGVGGAELDFMIYGGANSIYGVQGVDNTISIANGSNRHFEQSNFKYEMAETSGNALPAGMELSEDGTLSGAPAQAGIYTFTVTLKEDTTARFPYKSVPKAFKLEVFSSDRIPNAIIFKDDNLGVIPHGFEFSKSIKSAVVFDSSGHLSADISYALAPDSELPEGLKLIDGVITGITTADPGSYFFTIIASSAGKQSTALDFIVKIKAYSISFTEVTVPKMTVGKPASINVGTATSEDNIQISYSLKPGSKLPEGLTLVSSSGLIYGTPTKAYNDYSFTVVASGKDATPKEITYTVTVYGIVFDKITYSDILIGKDYSFKLSAAVNDGKSPELFYQVKEGSTMPQGFTLLADGTIIGSGVNFGEQSFIVQVIADGYIVAESTVTLDIYDIFAELPTGEDGGPIVKKGCSSAVTGGDFGIGILGSLALLCGAIMVIKRKKTNS